MARASILFTEAAKLYLMTMEQDIMTAEDVGCIWYRLNDEPLCHCAFEQSDKKAEKEKKAQEFLKSWLTDDEYKDLQDDGLIIPSKITTGKTYKVKRHANMMVEVYYNGKLDHKLCAIDSTGGYENDDTVLSKILMLTANEEQFLQVAEKHELITNGWITVNQGYILNNVNSTWSATPDTLTITWGLDGSITLRSDGPTNSGSVVSVSTFDSPTDVRTISN